MHANIIFTGKNTYIGLSPQDIDQTTQNEHEVHEKNRSQRTAKFHQNQQNFKQKLTLKFFLSHTHEAFNQGHGH